jgi:hypothetical protein
MQRGVVDVNNEINMDVAATSDTGAVVLGLAGKVKEHLATALQGSLTVASGNPGWTSAAELGNCAAAWQDHLVALADEMGRTGEDVRVTADQYDWADTEVAKRLSTSLDSLVQA